MMSLSQCWTLDTSRYLPSCQAFHLGCQVREKDEVARRPPECIDGNVLSRTSLHILKCVLCKRKDMYTIKDCGTPVPFPYLFDALASLHCQAPSAAPPQTNTPQTKLSSTLRTLVSFHLRWTSTQPYRAISPLVARTSPGLHVEYSAVNESSTLCPTLKTLFGEIHKCEDRVSATSPLGGLGS